MFLSQVDLTDRRSSINVRSSLQFRDRAAFEHAGSVTHVARLGLRLPALLALLLVGWPLSLAHAQNQTAAENALPGTADWRLTSPATVREIEGYASAASVNRGDSIALFVNTNAARYRLEVFRTGWYQGLGARRVFGPVTLTGQVQQVPSPNPLTGMVDCNWIESYSLLTRDAVTQEPWRTGVYLARLTELAGGKQAYIIFVVRDDAIRPDVLFQLPVTTYQAYNFWGGKSLYEWGSGAAPPWGSTRGARASKVSFNRPYAVSTDPAAAYGNGAGEYLTNVQPVAQGYNISSAGWDYNMVRWLEREGYNVAYVTNIDLHRSAGQISNSKIFLSSGHDEYWTWQMRANAEAARDAGVNLAFFSANTCYWQIRLEASPATGAPNRVIVGYKDASLDPYSSDADPANDRYVTTLWRARPVSRPEEALKGSQYIREEVDDDLIVTNSSHWVFAGTGLANQERIRGLLGYEVDGRFGSEPPSTVTLTSTPVVSQPTGLPGQYSQMTIYTAASGARVFGTGTIQWSWGLDDFNVPALRSSRASVAAVTITRNVLQAFGAEPGTKAPSSAIAASCVRLRALSEINGRAWTSAAEIDVLDAQGRALSKAGWTVAGFDSQEVVGQNGWAINAIDGQAGTIWHTQWSGGSPGPPHYIDINLGQARSVSGLQYLPRQDGGVNGTIAGYEVYTSADCSSWIKVASGTFAANTTRQVVTFTAPSVTPPLQDVTPPTIPTGLRAAAAGPSQVSLSWNPSSDSGSGVAGYRVFRNGVAVGTATTTNYADTGLGANTLYSYTVSAYDASSPANESAQSSAASITTPPLQDVTPPTIPTGLRAAAAGPSQVSLSWNPSSDSGSGVAGYRVFRNGVAVGTATTTNYADTGLGANTLYSYTVSAYDASSPANESAQSSAASITTPPLQDVTPPTIPTGLRAAAAGPSQVSLSWNPSSDSGSGVAGYRVFRNGVAVGTATTTNYADTGLGANTLYSYTVSAYDASSPANESAQSSAASITTPPLQDVTPPTIPTGLRAAAAGPSQVSLSWNPSSDSGSGVAGYRVFRNGVAVGTATTTNYADTGLGANTLYSYTVSAYDASSPANESAQSSAASITTPPLQDVTPPTIPTGLRAAAAGPSQVSLSWNPSSDSGSGVAGYRVFRNGVAVGTATTTNYADTGLGANTLYSYTVSAYDASSPANESAQSGAASATTTIPIEPGTNSRSANGGGAWDAVLVALLMGLALTGTVPLSPCPVRRRPPLRPARRHGRAEFPPFPCRKARQGRAAHGAVDRQREALQAARGVPPTGGPPAQLAGSALRDGRRVR